MKCLTGVRPEFDEAARALAIATGDGEFLS